MPRASLASALGVYGQLVARHPLKILAVGFTLLAALAAGLAAGRADETRSAHLWTPTSTKAFRDWRAHEDAFGEDRPKLVAYLRPVEGGNALTHAVFKQALAVHEFTVDTCEAASADGGNGPVTFDGACDKYAGDEACAVSNFLTLFKYNAATLDQLAPYIPLLVNGLHQVVNASTFAGGLKFGRDEATGRQTVESATALALIYTLRDDSADVAAFSRAWHAGIEAAVDPAVVEIAHVSPAAVGDALAADAAADAPKLVVAVCVLVALLVVALGSPTSCTRSRFILGAAASGVGALSAAAGYGACEAAAVPFNSMATLQLLLLLAAQAESSLALADALAAQPAELPLDERVGRAARAAGVGVVCGQLAAAAAALVGLHSDMPGIASLCAYGGASLACGAVGALAVFLPLLVLDEMRAGAGRLSWLPCLRMPRTDTNAPAGDAPALGVGADADAPYRPTRDGALGWALGAGLARALRAPAVALLVVSAVGTCAGLSAAHAASLGVGLDEAAALPSESHVQRALALERDEFGGRLLVASVVFENASYVAPADRTAVLKGVNEIDELDFLYYRWPLWMHAYEGQYLPTRRATAPGGWTEHVRDFLDAPEFARFGRHVQCDGGSAGACVAPTRTRLEVLYSRGTADAALTHARRDALEAAATSDGGGVRAFAWSAHFLTTAIDEVIVTRTTTHLLAALGVAAGVLLACAPPAVALCAAVSICAAGANLLGVLALLGLPLTFLSYAALAMGACFLVLPSTRVACAYAEAVDATARSGAHHAVDAAPRGTGCGCGRGGARALRVALATAGASVTRAAVISVCALVTLRGARSAAFVPFFQVSVCAVGLGAAHALVFLPALLALLAAAGARSNGSAEAKTSPEDPADESEAAR